MPLRLLGVTSVVIAPPFILAAPTDPHPLIELAAAVAPLALTIVVLPVVVVAHCLPDVAPLPLTSSMTETGCPVNVSRITRMTETTTITRVLFILMMIQ